MLIFEFLDCYLLIGGVIFHLAGIFVGVSKVIEPWYDGTYLSALDWWGFGCQILTFIGNSTQYLISTNHRLESGEHNWILQVRVLVQLISVDARGRGWVNLIATRFLIFQSFHFQTFVYLRREWKLRLPELNLKIFLNSLFCTFFRLLSFFIYCHVIRLTHYITGIYRRFLCFCGRRLQLLVKDIWRFLAFRRFLWTDSMLINRGKRVLFEVRIAPLGLLIILFVEYLLVSKRSARSFSEWKHMLAQNLTCQGRRLIALVQIQYFWLLRYDSRVAVRSVGFWGYGAILSVCLWVLKFFLLSLFLNLIIVHLFDNLMG